MPLAPPLPEIALIGRSNVGKSSLLNAIAGRRIAKVSATPGKTRALNVYELHLARREKGEGRGEKYVPRHLSRLPSPLSLYVLDLPGYGYAKAGKAERAAYQRLITYTLERPRLAGVVWLLDIRRDPSPADRDIQDAFAARGTRILAAITKADKLPHAERRERELREALGVDADQLIVTSARLGAGVPELRLAIEQLVKGAAA